VIGTILDGKYRITRQLGAGAMGSVYEAEHTATGRRVAVKVISSADLAKDQKTVDRFKREARAAGAIDTQHITQVTDAGMDRELGFPFLVMELLAGEDLQHLLKRVGPVAPDLVLRIVAQACLGLQKAHEAQVVHRDIKPANIFLARRDAGEVIIKILDFGIAKMKMDQSGDPEANGLTQTGSMLGSPLYMSPEQARGMKDIDHRADIWSLGVVFYQALCGRTPYQHATALGELIIAICSEFPPQVQDFAPWVPPEIAAIVHRAIRQNREERYQSADEMFAAMRPLLTHGWSISQDVLVPLQDSTKQLVAPRFSLTNVLAAAQTVPPPPPAHIPQIGGMTTGPVTQSQPSIPPPATPSRAPVWIGIGGLLVAAVVGTYAFLQSRAPTPPLPPVQATVAPIPAPTVPAPVATPTEAPRPVIPVDLSIRRVKVVVLPVDVAIEVDGKRAVLRNSYLEIEGTLGSTHRVRLSKGKNEAVIDVAVTDSGPAPPKIELTSGGVKGMGVDAGTAATPPRPPPTRPDINPDPGEFEKK
jgi:eukaryotic-like serine/threonine-protein kinase